MEQNREKVKYNEKHKHKELRDGGRDLQRTSATHLSDTFVNTSSKVLYVALVISRCISSVVYRTA
ncbi:hypothetical protein CRENBAI_013771, partial [Crenichthys baileyi]